MPVDRANRHAQLGSQRGLVDIRIALDFFEQGEFAGGFFGFHNSKFSH